MADAEPERADLDGWPTYSLEAAGVRQIAGGAFRELIAHPPKDRDAYAVETDGGGTVAARIIDHQRRDTTDACRYFLDAYLTDTTLAWEPERLILLNEPCYISTASGVVLLEDGRIVTDTLFPTGRSGL